MRVSHARITDIHSISPEQQRALSVLNSNLPKWSTLLRDNSFAHKVLTTNFVCFSTESIKDLPKKNCWVWNQSNAKIRVQLNANTMVTFQKMNTRKKKNAPKPPAHKLWMFLIESSDPALPKKLHFIWCEKGTAKVLNCSNPPHLKITEGCSFAVVDHKNSGNDLTCFRFDSPRNSGELAVSQLAFLKPFIEPNLAQELGW
uniref:Uncharacterized protein n=1 Tax=Vannella robusta TaxID=1487602 RepID=A0A6U1UBA8_9EUKA|mmetsp:Transcript_19471/g.24588  ORF Transcript_19471/g.24588 Transcript_19471/m.24588 type:complete len:201 (+) Transcript_19471:864-1466(+)